MKAAIAFAVLAGVLTNAFSQAISPLLMGQNVWMNPNDKVWQLVTDCGVQSIRIGSMSYGNLALGKTATASSVAQGNVATNAVDGNATTRWESSAADNQSLCIDLGAPSQIDSVTLSWEAAYASSYEFDVTNDTTNWTGKAVYQTTAGTGGKESIRGLNAIGRYVRILCIKRGTGWGNSLYEFGVYGMPLAMYSTTSVSAGAHTWNVTAIDKAGNKTVAKKAFSVTVQ